MFSLHFATENPMIPVVITKRLFSKRSVPDAGHLSIMSSRTFATIADF